jgi:hypothetical protein
MNGVRKFNIFVLPLWCAIPCSREHSVVEEDPVDQLHVRSWNSDALTVEHMKGFVGNLQRARHYVWTDRQTDRQTRASHARKVGGSRYLIIEINF